MTAPTPTTAAAPLSAEEHVSGTLAFFASCIRSGESWDSTCEQAYARAKESLAALLAARRENDRAIEAWSRTEGERLKLEQEVRDLRTALNAALAATQEPR